MEYKVGELVLLPETKYPGVIGSVISERSEERRVGKEC